MARSMFQGGVAAMAGAAASHPLDLIKVRLQIQGEGPSVPGQNKLGPVAMGKSIFRNDGAKGMFSGLTASLLRQALYSSVRFGVYDKLKTSVGQAQGKDELNVWQKVGCGLAAGGVGAICANPADVAMVRMQADGKLPVHARRNYKNVLDGLVQISRQEGIAALWAGSGPTVVRAMIVTASQFAAYDQIKYTLITRAGMKDNPVTHLTSAFAAGFVASLTSNPVDVIKTRMMNSTKGTYKNPVDCTFQLIRGEGVMALYKGFVPTFVRQAPYLVVMFVTLEQIKSGFRYMDEREVLKN